MCSINKKYIKKPRHCRVQWKKQTTLLYVINKTASGIVVCSERSKRHGMFNEEEKKQTTVLCMFNEKASRRLCCVFNDNSRTPLLCIQWKKQTALSGKLLLWQNSPIPFTGRLATSETWRHLGVERCHRLQSPLALPSASCCSREHSSQLPVLLTPFAVPNSTVWVPERLALKLTSPAIGSFSSLVCGKRVCGGKKLL